MSDDKKYAGQLRNFTTWEDEHDEAVVDEVEETEPTDEEKWQALLVTLDPSEFLTYFTKRFMRVHGFEYKTSWAKEQKIMERFIRTYGRAAADIMKYVFDHDGGKWKGQAVSANLFNEKWVTDEIYARMKGEAQEARVRKPTAGRMMSGERFLQQLGR